MSEEIIELDGTTIDALASSTRRNILKQIQIRPMTVSELGRVLSIHKSAIFKHLEILQGADLITKRYNNNEFVYYELTMKGRGITEQKRNTRIKFLFFFSVSVGLLILSLLVISVTVNRVIAPQYWDAPHIDVPYLITGLLLLLFAGIFFIFGFRLKKIPDVE